MLSYKATQLDSYNKVPKGHGTLIANWYEEGHLRNLNGQGRSITNFHFPKKHQVLLGSEPEEVQKLIEGRQVQDTDLRIMGVKKYNEMKTENHQYGKGYNKADQFPKVGLRQQLIEKQFLQQTNHTLALSKQQFNEEASKRQLTTTNKQFFQKPAQDPTQVIGRRRMRNTDGQPIPYSMKDEQLLTSFGFYQRKQITDDETLRAMLPKDQAYSQQQPITFWRQKLQDGFIHNSKVSGRKNQFHKNNQFLKTFHHYTHVKL